MCEDLYGGHQVPKMVVKVTAMRLAADFGMEESLVRIFMKSCLQWLGHLSHMEYFRMPKQLLFDELEK